MSDDFTKRDLRNRDRIDLNEKSDVKYWSETFGITPRQLRKAVEQFGPLVDDVRRYLVK